VQRFVEEDTRRMCFHTRLDFATYNWQYDHCQKTVEKYFV